MARALNARLGGYAACGAPARRRRVWLAGGGGCGSTTRALDSCRLGERGRQRAELDGAGMGAAAAVPNFESWCERRGEPGGR